MCGMDEMRESLFIVRKLEDFVPADHPPRPIRLLVNEALRKRNGLFYPIQAGADELATTQKTFAAKIPLNTALEDQGEI